MIIHPFEPLFRKDSKILILGSFPSVKSREENFFYGHPQNRFWKVIYNVFGDFDEIREHPFENPDDKRAFLYENGIALWDVIHSCDITGSSDSSIKNVVANDISGIIKSSQITRVFVNGQTAFRYYNRYIRDVAGIESICLPSTSPANAAWKIDRLIDAWKEIRDDI